MTAVDDVARALDPRVAGLSPSATLAIQQRANALIAEGHTVYKLGLGQSPFPVPLPVVEALRSHATEKDYLHVRGLHELRAAVARYHRLRDGLARSPDDVLIGPGSKELMFQLQLCFDGELLIPTPAWVSYAPQARLAGRRMRYLRTDPEDGFRLRPEMLAAACAMFERAGLAIAQATPRADADSDAQAHFGPLALYLSAGFSMHRTDSDGTLWVRRRLGGDGRTPATARDPASSPATGR